MKIIQVLNKFLPNQIAGTEIYTWTLCKNLQKTGNEVKVIIPNFDSTKTEEYNYDGIPVCKYAESTLVDRRLILGFRDPNGLEKFTEFLKCENPDIVHFHEFGGGRGIGISHVREAKKLGIKVVITFHLASYSCRTGTLMYKEKHNCNGKICINKCSSCFLHKKGLGIASNFISFTSGVLNYYKIDSTNWNNSIGTGLGTSFIIKRLEEDLNELIKLSDQVVSLTKWYREVLIVNGVDAKKISYIAQGLPTQSYFRNKIRFENKVLKLMYLGRITEIKGLDLLIEAVKLIPSNQIELSIYGYSDGTNFENILRESTILNTNIIWKGGLSPDDVQFEMSRHDLFCLCSRVSEMSPLVIEEAKAVSLPVLASNVRGNLEQIEDGISGMIFEINNVQSLRSQILKVITDREILDRLKRNIRQPRNFEKVTSEYLNLYNKILS